MTSSPFISRAARAVRSAADTPKARKELALVVLGGVLYFLGFVGFDIFPLTWICFVPALWALRDVSPGRALFLGTVFGLATNLGGYYWVIHLLSEFAYLPLPLAVLGYVLLCLYQGGLLAIVLWLVHRAKTRLGVAPVWSLAAAFPALELAYPLLFPSYIGNSQYQFTAITQFVDITGMLGLTALIALVNGAIYELLEARLDRRPIARLRPIVPAVCFVAALGYGLVRLPAVDAKSAAAKQLTVGIVQTNIGAREKHARAEEFIKKHQRMSKALIAEHPEIELLVWPESAYNGALPKNVKNVKDKVTEGIDRPVIFGAITYAYGPDQTRDVWNTALLADAKGDVIGMFDKVVLLAFGETIPLVDTFPAIKKWFPQTGLFTRGKIYEAFSVPGAKLLPMICYEDIIPSFVREMWHRAGPTGALVNVTNDSWYGDTHEPLIHLVLASFRSIETRRALIRSTNTGISAIVDPAGRLAARTGQWTEENLVAKVPIIEDGSTTIYMTIGDAVGWIALALVVFGVLRSRAPAAKPSKKR